ncbi:hypothetical protein B0J13DRAFT_50892 [Dactylonectria estremocensis]|uniref:Uncharacterized protein n=1 Tax=Dactylonectria estremocensis TaxID=1079267 RepID=A0A9P9J1Z4_9HYPO|nr:hypothetical protein B0J13DRAFT_50892 [Dactylonectria estremocensis]
MSFPFLQPPVLFCFLLVFAVNVDFASAATSTEQFKNWYPQYGWIFNKIRQVNCTVEYDNYLTGVKDHSKINWLAGGGRYTALTQPLIDCILLHTSEYLKVSMTSAQVLLGVMPTIVALLGPSRDEIAMLANVGRRPLLALGLAFGSPSAYFSRAFEYSEPAKILSHAENRHKQWRPKHALTQALVSSVEYLVTAAAVVNVLNNTLQVDRWAINSLSSDTDFLPTVWVGLGACLHIFSCIVFRLRLQGWRHKQRRGDETDEQSKSEENNNTDESPEESRQGLLGSSLGHLKSLSRWLKDTGPRLFRIATTTELVPCAASSYVVRIKVFRESKTFLLAAWWESTFTILHLVFGTLIFSGMLFVGSKDALGVVGRYIAGAAVCRVILMYELAGLRESWVQT